LNLVPFALYNAFTDTSFGGSPAGIIRFCHQYDIQTVVAFSREVENVENSVHVRDFCPALASITHHRPGWTSAAYSVVIFIAWQHKPGAQTKC